MWTLSSKATPSISPTHARQYGGRVVPHQRFNTAKWLLEDADYPVDTAALLARLDSSDGASALPTHLDFVTARTEFYTAPTVLPTVERGSIKLDLHRRDFTINTLAICLNPDRWGELLDFYGGLNDLDRGRSGCCTASALSMIPRVFCARYAMSSALISPSRRDNGTPT